MNTTDSGRLGEVKVLARLVEMGWYPFTDISGKCPVDILAWKDGEVRSFQVKCCEYSVSPGSYTVLIQSVRPNTKTNVVKPFDNTSVDYLSVFFPIPDKVCFFQASDISVKATMAVRVVDMDKYGMVK